MESEKLKQNLEQIRQLTDECLLNLRKAPFDGKKLTKEKESQKITHLPQLDFTKSIRAFIKEYSKGMSGPKKFTLLLARLTKGDTNKSIKLDEIKKNWKKGLFEGKINSFYSTQAKDKDWIDSKRSEYSLRPSWEKIFKK